MTCRHNHIHVFVVRNLSFVVDKELPIQGVFCWSMGTFHILANPLEKLVLLNLESVYHVFNVSLMFCLYLRDVIITILNANQISAGPEMGKGFSTGQLASTVIKGFYF